VRSSSTTARAGNKWWRSREIRRTPRDNKQRKVVSCRGRSKGSGGRSVLESGARRRAPSQFPFKLMQTVPAAGSKRRIPPTFFPLRAAAMMNICVTPFVETERRNESARPVYAKSSREGSHFSREFCITRPARAKRSKRVTARSVPTKEPFPFHPPLLPLSQTSKRDAGKSACIVNCFALTSVQASVGESYRTSGSIDNASACALIMNRFNAIMRLLTWQHSH